MNVEVVFDSVVLQLLCGSDRLFVVVVVGGGGGGGRGGGGGGDLAS